MSKTVQNILTLIVLLGFLIGAITKQNVILSIIFVIGIIIYIAVKFGDGSRGNWITKKSAR